MTYISSSVEATEQLGASLARILSPGDIVAFTGELGAGKTAFIRGMAVGLGLDFRVTSPTYTIVNEYPGAIPLFHFDLYRLGGSDELYDIGWEDYISRGGICAVEWSERAVDELSGCITVNISRLSDDERSIIIEGIDENAMSCP